MIVVNSVSEVKGKFVRDDVEVLEEPYFDDRLGKWCALANAYGMLAIIELRVTPQPTSSQGQP